MALIKCKECGKEHSDSAKACPHCGFKRTQIGVFGFICVLFLAYMIFHFASYSPDQPGSPSAAAVPQKSPEEIAAAAKKEAAFQKVVLIMKGVRAANRNPESVKWESVRANDDASIICIQYRGQNGFGGMSKEFVVVVKEAASQKVSMWNRHCTQVLNDIGYAVHAL